uniref:NADAR domain-containing protein n=1 Tax=Meloidogyne enterolobii TaxID=390850 RepID=A0A6V7WRE2_MELEN|nr:unnamed protein product [Meloidogyne enterolobii]
MSAEITPFFTKKYVFSNHYGCHFEIDNISYFCVEQFYMRFKALVFGDFKSVEMIMEAKDAGAIKRIGSKIKDFNHHIWRKLCIIVMVIGNLAKYRQNGNLRKLLFKTGDSLLVEASPFDTYWGVGVGLGGVYNRRNWRGLNVLGRILTRIRDNLKSQSKI